MDSGRSWTQAPPIWLSQDFKFGVLVQLKINKIKINIGQSEGLSNNYLIQNIEKKKS